MLQATPSLQAIDVHRDAVADLRRRHVALDHPSSSWPTAALPEPGGQTLELMLRVRSMLRGEAGWAWLAFGAPGTRDGGELCAAAWNLFTGLCSPIAQYDSGELVCAVEVAELGAGVRHYSSSNQEGAFHTDGTLLARSPDVVGLFGVSQAGEGGETVLIDVRRLLREPALRDCSGVLCREHGFSSFEPGGGALTSRTAPILTLDPPEVRYLRLYLEDTYKRRGAEVPTELRAAMDVLDGCAAEPSHQLRMLLHPGDLLVWDNRRFLHGRRAFSEAGRRRRLRRFYGVWCER